MLKKKNLSFKNRKDNKKEDITWVLDGIVGFLQSPTWTVPIMNFVEDNCSCKLSFNALVSANLIFNSF